MTPWAECASQEHHVTEYIFICSFMFLHRNAVLFTRVCMWFLSLKCTLNMLKLLQRCKRCNWIAIESKLLTHACICSSHWDKYFFSFKLWNTSVSHNRRCTWTFFFVYLLSSLTVITFYRIHDLWFNVLFVSKIVLYLPEMRRCKTRKRISLIQSINFDTYTHMLSRVWTNT